jgi:ribosomal protein L16 Arg81 hydroxylase
MPPTTIDAVLAPYALDRFLADVWGKQCLHVKGAPGKFASLLPWDSYNALVQRSIMNPLTLRLVKEGKGVPLDDFAKKVTLCGKETLQIRPVEFAKQLRDGASIVFDHVQEHYDPVARLAESFQFVLHETVNVNSYAGFRTNNGFDLHWDGHDVFILQVSGRKKWIVYGADQKHPLKGGGKPGAPPPTPPVWEGVLEDGDMLYFPCGWWHIAFPLDGPSLHLTVGVRQRTGVDLVEYVGKQLERSELVRAPLPRFASPAERQERAAQLRDEILSQLTPDVVDRALADDDDRAVDSPMLGMPWTALPELVLPDDDALVRFTLARSIPLQQTPDGAQLFFVARGRKWKFASGARPMIERLCDARQVSIGELCALASATMRREQVRSLLAKLVSQGMVAIVEASLTALPAPRAAVPPEVAAPVATAGQSREAVVEAV